MPFCKKTGSCGSPNGNHPFTRHFIIRPTPKTKVFAHMKKRMPYNENGLFPENGNGDSVWNKLVSMFGKRKTNGTSPLPMTDMWGDRELKHNETPFSMPELPGSGLATLPVSEEEPEAVLFEVLVPEGGLDRESGPAYLLEPVPRSTDPELEGENEFFIPKESKNFREVFDGAFRFTGTEDSHPFPIIKNEPGIVCRSGISSTGPETVKELDNGAGIEQSSPAHDELNEAARTPDETTEYDLDHIRRLANSGNPSNNAETEQETVFECIIVPCTGEALSGISGSEGDSGIKERSQFDSVSVNCSDVGNSDAIRIDRCRHERMKPEETRSCDEDETCVFEVELPASVETGSFRDSMAHITEAMREDTHKSREPMPPRNTEEEVPEQSPFDETAMFEVVIPDGATISVFQDGGAECDYLDNAAEFEVETAQMEIVTCPPPSKRPLAVQNAAIEEIRKERTDSSRFGSAVVAPEDTHVLTEPKNESLMEKEEIQVFEVICSRQGSVAGFLSDALPAGCASGSETLVESTVVEESIIEVFPSLMAGGEQEQEEIPVFEVLSPPM